MVPERSPRLSRGPAALPVVSGRAHGGQGTPALRPDLVRSRVFPLATSLPSTAALAVMLGLVRRLRWYYGAVRLPVTVHHRGTSLDFPMRSVFISTDSHGLSRLPLKVLACMLRVSDRARVQKRLAFATPPVLPSA